MRALVDPRVQRVLLARRCRRWMTRLRQDGCHCHRDRRCCHCSPCRRAVGKRVGECCRARQLSPVGHARRRYHLLYASILGSAQLGLRFELGIRLRRKAQVMVASVSAPKLLHRDIRPSSRTRSKTRCHQPRRSGRRNSSPSAQARAAHLRGGWVMIF